MTLVGKGFLEIQAQIREISGSGVEHNIPSLNFTIEKLAYII